jgi:YVTN family beta-propeller protein
VAVGDGEVWVANELDGTVSEVNPGAGRTVATIPVGIGPSAIAVGDGSVWVANLTSDTLSRINASTGLVSATIPLSATPDGIAFGAGAVWVISQETGQLLGIDPAGNRPARAISIARNPDGVAVGAGGVWIADADGAVSRFDPRTGQVRTIQVGGSPAGVACSAGAVWVTDGLSGTVSRIDPQTGQTQVIRVGNEPTEIAAGGSGVWVTVLPSAASHRGGTLTLIGPQAPPDHPGLPTDPAVAYDLVTWQMLSLTNDGLVGYRRVAGLAGDELVPDLAVALPSPGDGGRSYGFLLRPGIRYSTGALVRPEDFRRAIERVLDIDKQQNSSILSFYAGIAGAQQCERSRRPCDLSRGIVTDDAANTVTFHLVAPDPEFLYKLAFSWAYAIPGGAPDRMISATQLPATGPYMTKTLVQGHVWILVRNPRFRQWSAQAQPDGYPGRMVVRFDIGPGQAVADVEAGKADVLLSPLPDSVAQLATHYTSQLHSGPLAATIALTLNTRMAPFDKLGARQAVNYAIDRNLVVALNGGPLAAQATCQILPPTMPGYQPYCPYTIQPDTPSTCPKCSRADRWWSSPPPGHNKWGSGFPVFRDREAAGQYTPVVESGPVFADSSGRRRRVLRFAGLGAAAVLAVCLGAVVVAMTGGPQAPFTHWAVQQPAQAAPTGRASQQAVGGSPSAGRSNGAVPGSAGGQNPAGGTPGSTTPGTSHSPAPSTGASPTAGPSVGPSTGSSPAPTNPAGKTPPGHTKSPNPRRSAIVA